MTGSANCLRSSRPRPKQSAGKCARKSGRGSAGIRRSRRSRNSGRRLIQTASHNRGSAMSTAGSPAPLTHQAFRQRQRGAELDGLTYKPLRVAWTDVGEGEPVILLHGIPTWSFLYNEVIPLLAPHSRVIAPDFLGHGYSDRRDFFDRSLLAQTNM